MLPAAALLLICAATSVEAQREPRLRPGVHAGFGYTFLDYSKADPSWTADARFSPNAGVQLEVLFMNGTLRVVPAARFFRAESKIDVNSGRDPVSQLIGEIDVTLDYLAVPVTVRYKPARNAGFFLFAGPEFGYLISAKQKSVIREITNETDINVIVDEETDIKDTLKSFNISGVAGLGQQREFAGRLLSVQLGYNYGLLDIVDDGVTAGTTQFQTRAFEFILAFSW